MSISARLAFGAHVAVDGPVLDEAGDGSRMQRSLGFVISMRPARRSTKDLSERKRPRNKTKEAFDCYRSAIMYARPVMLHGKRRVPGCASKAQPGFWPAAIMTFLFSVI